MARHLRLTSPEPPRTPAKILNFCRTCGQDFGGVRAFDLHRVGTHAYDYSTSRPDGRRCLTTDEMLARGLYPNATGRWSQPPNGLLNRLGSGSAATPGVIATA
jgi:hypothetical protein